MKLKKGNVTISIEPTNGLLDVCLNCPVAKPQHDYFDDACFLSARIEYNRSIVTGTAVDLERVIRTARSRKDVVWVQPDPELRRILLFARPIKPSDTSISDAAEHLVGDVARLREARPWVHNFRITQFQYLSRPERSLEIMNGVVKALESLSTEGVPSRWLFDMQQSSISIFKPLLSAVGFHSVTPSNDTEPVKHLLEAIKKIDNLSVERILKSKPNLDLIGGNGVSPLMMACSVGNFNAARMILGAGAKVDLANPVGKTALSIAAQYGQLELNKILIAAGANPKTPSYRGETPLMFAADCGSLDTVHLLLAAGASKLNRNKNGKTAEDFALQGGHRDVAAILNGA